MILLIIFCGIIVVFFAARIILKYKLIKNLKIDKLWENINIMLIYEEVDKKTYRKLKKTVIYDFSKYDSSNIVGVTLKKE